MKKIIVKVLFILIIFVILCAAIVNFNNKENSNLKVVKVAEVAHSIFYAPQYVALHKGYFEEVGLDVEFILTAGADKVTASSTLTLFPAYSYPGVSPVGVVTVVAVIVPSSNKKVVTSFLSSSKIIESAIIMSST